MFFFLLPPNAAALREEMIDLTPRPRPARSPRPPRKLASGPLRSNPDKYTYRIDPQALQPRRKYSPTATATAPGVSVYGFRFYVPSLGRWPNRDPIRERGGVNLYEFIESWPQNSTDHFGLSESDFECCTDDVISDGRDYVESAWPGALDAAEREWGCFFQCITHEDFCANINNSALGQLGDIPRCWHCEEERRRGLIVGGRVRRGTADRDHVIVCCIAVDQNGEVADQLILDGTGGQTDYDEFCRTWPIPGPSKPGPNPKDCRKCRSDFNPTWDVSCARSVGLL